MKNSRKLFWKLRRGDFVVFLAVLALAGGILFYYASVGTGGEYGEIWQNGRLVKRVKLAEGYTETVTVNGEKVTNVIEINGKRMRFISSDCNDQICVNTGWVSSTGQTAVCLPNRVILKITGQQQDDNVDIIVS